MATTITSTQVVTDFGAYYIDQGQNMSNIHDRLREDFGTRAAFNVIESEDTVLREVNVAYAEVLQSFQTTFTPKGGVTFTPKSIPLYNVKMDQSFYPDALKNQWIAFLTSNNTDRTTWPFVAWFIEIYCMGQIKADLEKVIYKAVFNAPTAGIANNAVDTMNGIKKTINTGITGATIAPIMTGAPSTDPETWCNQVEDFVSAIPELYWSTGLTINMSRVLAKRYKKGRRIKYNINYAQVNDLTVVEDFENVTIAGYGSHAGATKIWTTPKLNSVLGFKGGSNQNTVEVEKVDRLVKIYTDFWIGMGFIDDGIIFTNDQDLS